jgi:putative peptidoglycan lipid II flippase
MMAALVLAALFPTPGHAAAWGVLVAGVLEALLVGGDAWRSGDLPRWRRPRLDVEMKTFLKRFAPATIGSAETQIALFADTIIASFLATGALSALYYADRLNQLPIGVIGIAAGTVLLPEMARRIAAGDERGARHAQNRAVELTLLLSIPCMVAFLLVPEPIMLALFGRGAFTQADAAAAAATLSAYAVGLIPFVLLRSVTVTFLARGDTITPVKTLAVAVAVNVALKILLAGRYAQAGLAFATSIGAWVNFALLLWLAARKQLIAVDDRLARSAGKLALAGLLLALALFVGQRALTGLLPASSPLRAETTLALLAVIGAVFYFGAVLALFGKQWLAAFRRRQTQ